MQGSGWVTVTVTLMITVRVWRSIDKQQEVPPMSSLFSTFAVADIVRVTDIGVSEHPYLRVNSNATVPYRFLIGYVYINRILYIYLFIYLSIYLLIGSLSVTYQSFTVIHGYSRFFRLLTDGYWRLQVSGSPSIQTR